jgi:hypothetical protein
MARTFYKTVLGLLLMSLAATADDISLTLTPSGAVSGPPGSTVGWGFSITNNDTLFLVAINSFFCQTATVPPEDPAFTGCTQTLGTYTDLIGSNATVVAPGDTANESFDGVNGFGEYTINDPASGVDSGSLVLWFNFWTANPFTDSTATTDGVTNEVFSDAASVTVTAVTSAVPEPGTLLLLGSCIAMIAARRSWFHRRRESGRRAPER